MINKSLSAPLELLIKIAFLKKVFMQFTVSLKLQILDQGE